MKLLEDFNQLVDTIKPERPLSQEESMMMMGILMSKDESLKQEVTSEYPDFKGFIGVQIFLKRIEMLSTLKFTLGAAVFIGSLLESPGSAVVHAYYLHRKLAPNTLVDMNTICMDIFPMGVLSDTQEEKLWDAQKILTEEEREEAKTLECYAGPDNLLDYKLVWDK